jgi:hypothetical protein
MKPLKHDPEKFVSNDAKYPTGKKVCFACGEEKKLRDFLIGRHSNTGQLYRFARCRKCSATTRKPETVARNLASDRIRNRAQHYGEPETTWSGKVFRTGHLEKYIRTAWAE